MGASKKDKKASSPSRGAGGSSTSSEKSVEPNDPVDEMKMPPLSGAALSAIAVTVFSALKAYFQILVHYLLNGNYDSAPNTDDFMKENAQARLFLHSIGLVFRLWQAPHYRCPSFAHDLRENLRNVAVPGTAIPLSLFFYFKGTAVFFFVCLYPWLALIAALVLLLNEGKRWEGGRFLTLFAQRFRKQLLMPDDWFTYWRMNSGLAALHSFVVSSSSSTTSSNKNAKTPNDDYSMENKWDFLVRATEKSIPITPCIGLGAAGGNRLASVRLRHLVAKDKNCEGGMGIHFFHNAAEGGDWILQERLENSAALANLLPKPAPLSTLRVLTSSTGGLTIDNVVVEAEVDPLT